MKAALAWMLLLTGCATVAPEPSRPLAPFADYHQHLVSPAFAPIVHFAPRDGRALLAELDAAGIHKAVVLSTGYSFADERKGLDDPDRLTREENDWTAAQVAGSGDRLIGFCGVNPLRPSAVEELERCLGLPGMRGLKLHLGNSGVSLRDPQQLARMTELFQLANRLRAPVLVHMRARGGSNFGAEDGRLFLEKLVPAAPDVELVIAHFGGAGPGYPDQADEVMAVFGEAAERRDPRLRNLYFDVATIVTAESTPGDGALIAKRIRQVGAERVLYGSDLNPPGGSIRAGWELFRGRVPLTEPELRALATNRPRFVR